MGVVGAAGAIGVAVPTVVVFGVSLITSKMVDYLFDKNIFAIKTISELYGEDINNRIQKFENKILSIWIYIVGYKLTNHKILTIRIKSAKQLVFSLFTFACQIHG